MSTAYLRSKYGADHVDRARTPAPIDSAGSLSPGWAEILGLSAPNTVKVTDDSVRGLPALDRAKGLVVNSVATMLVEASVCDSTGATVDKPEAIRRPHPLLQPFEFFEQVADSAVMHGNYVAVILGEGDDAQLIPVPLGSVSLDTSSGLPWYIINGRRYSYREIFHVRANAPIGTWWGVGVVEKFRTALSEHLHGQAFGEASFRSGAVPSVSLQLDTATPTLDETQAAKRSYMGVMSGGRREPLVHGTGLTVTPLSWSPHDAEFVEAMRINLATAALMVGLRPEDIGASLGSSLTYGNRSDDALQRITDGYGPWVNRIEGPLSDLLLDGREVKGNPEALLRTSTRERLEIRRIKQELGIETQAESRAEEGRGPLPTNATEEAA
jgi:phage portal protein BeeE